MIKFSEYLDEMAMVSKNTDRNYDVFSNEKVWDTNAEVKKRAQKITTVNGYDIFMAPGIETPHSMYLIKNDSYVASIDYVEMNIKNVLGLRIEYGYSKIRGGYKILLDGILDHSKYNFIMSDSNLSDRAGRFWEKFISETPHEKFLYNKNEKLLLKYDPKLAFGTSLHIGVSKEKLI